jgi:hypothetical protein
MRGGLSARKFLEKICAESTIPQAPSLGTLFSRGMLILANTDKTLEDVYSPGTLIYWVTVDDSHGGTAEQFEDGLVGIVLRWCGEVCEVLIHDRTLEFSRDALNSWRIR